MAVHGYDPNGQFGANKPEDIWDSRFRKAFSLADKLRKSGSEPIVFVTGGVEKEEKPESQHMLEYAEENFEEELEIFTVENEESSTTGLENIEEILDFMEKEDIKTVYSVTSPDHALRVEGTWQMVNPDVTYFTVSSDLNVFKGFRYYLPYIPVLAISGKTKEISRIFHP